MNLELGFERMEFGLAEKGKGTLLRKRCQNNSVQLSLDGDIRAVVPDFQRANTWNSLGSTVVKNTPSRQGSWVRSLIRLRSHMPQGQKSKTLKKKKKRILLTNSVKTLKTFHILIKKANTKRHSRDPGTSQGKALQLVP